jgi:hypothetical protein
MGAEAVGKRQESMIAYQPMFQPSVFSRENSKKVVILQVSQAFSVV